MGELEQHQSLAHLREGYHAVRHVGNHSRLYVKAFSEHRDGTGPLSQRETLNPYTLRNPQAGYHSEVTSLCRLATTRHPCLQASAGFPILEWRDDTALTIATALPPPPLVDAPPPLEQLRCLWASLQQAGVLHRDVSCKNTVLSRSGFLALIDFDAAYNFGDPWSQYRTPPLFHDAIRTHSPLSFEDFRSSLLPCFDIRRVDRKHVVRRMESRIFSDTGMGMDGDREVRLSPKGSAASMHAALGAAPRAMPVDYYSGYCGVTSGATDCERAAKGSWALTHSQRYDWATARRACEQLCHSCRNCKFISFSLKHGDCSWFRRCDLGGALLHEVAGFRSVALPAATHSRKRERRNRSLELSPADQHRRAFVQFFDAVAQARIPHVIVRGYSMLPSQPNTDLDVIVPWRSYNRWAELARRLLEPRVPLSIAKPSVRSIPLNASDGHAAADEPVRYETYYTKGPAADELPNGRFQLDCYNVYVSVNHRRPYLAPAAYVDDLMASRVLAPEPATYYLPSYDHEVTLVVLRCVFEKDWRPKYAMELRKYARRAAPLGVVHTMALAGLANPWDIYHLMVMATRRDAEWSLAEQVSTYSLPSQPRPEHGALILWREDEAIVQDAKASLDVVRVLRWRFASTAERYRLIQGIYEGKVNRERDRRVRDMGPVTIVIVRISRPKFVVRVSAGTGTVRTMDATLYDFKAKWRRRGRTFRDIHATDDKPEANLLFYTFDLFQFINPTAERIVHQHPCRVVEMRFIRRVTQQMNAFAETSLLVTSPSLPAESHEWGESLPVP